MITQKDLLLCSGHLVPEESVALFRKAKELGIRRLVLTHASEEVTRASCEIQQICKQLGVCVEHCMMGATPCCPGAIPFEQLAREIRESGVSSVVLSSDFGQIENGPIVASFTNYLRRMLDVGFSESEIDTMVRKNPEARTHCGVKAAPAAKLLCLMNVRLLVNMTE